MGLEFKGVLVRSIRCRSRADRRTSCGGPDPGNGPVDDRARLGRDEVAVTGPAERVRRRDGLGRVRAPVDRSEQEIAPHDAENLHEIHPAPTFRRSPVRPALGAYIVRTRRTLCQYLFGSVLGPCATLGVGPFGRESCPPTKAASCAAMRPRWT